MIQMSLKDWNGIFGLLVRTEVAKSLLGKDITNLPREEIRKLLCS